MASDHSLIQRPTLLLLAMGALLLVVSGFFYWNVEQFAASDRMIRHTHRVIVAITKAVSSLREAEAVQRGYVITGEQAYLAPYGPLVETVHRNWSELKALTVDDSAQQKRIARLEPLIVEKLADLELTISVRRDQDFNSARNLMMNNYGKDVMDIIRVEVDTMLDEEARQMADRNQAAEQAHAISIITILIFLASGLLLALVSVRLMRHTQNLNRAALVAQRRHEAQLEQKIMLRTSQVRQLASHLESVREEEKRAIARELHDDIGSSMTALSMVLEGHFRQNAEYPSVMKSAEKVRNLLTDLTQSTRRIQAGLRPNTLDSLGLTEAIREAVNEFSRRTEIECVLDLPPEEFEVPQLLQVPLFRLLQEALNNITKHAKATKVEISLIFDKNNALLKIIDNGIGMSPERLVNTKTHGLLGMRERAAYLEGHADIVSRPGEGTAVSISLPIPLS